MKKIFSLSEKGVFLALTALGCLIYSNTLHSSFVFDDFQGIVGNLALHHPSFSALWHTFNTRFIVGVSLALNYALGKDDVTGYHLFNTLIHILNAFLVYKLVCLTLSQLDSRQIHAGMTVKTSSPNALVGDHRLLAFLTALIFLTHPLQTQGVTYIWQRATSLATFFYLGSLVFYVRGRLGVGSSLLSPISYLLCLSFAVLGMFTKEIVFTLPFAILLYEFIFLRDQATHDSRLKHAGMTPKTSSPKSLVGDQVQHDSRLRPAGMTVAVWVLLALSLLIIPLAMTQADEQTLKFLRPNNAHFNPGQERSIVKDLWQMTRTTPLEKMPRHEFIMTEINVLRIYLRLFILPIHQSVDYDYPRARSLLEPNTLASLLLLLSLLGSGFLLLKKHPLLAFGIFWFFLTLSVESLVAQEEFIFEHRMYLPIVGLSLFLVAGLSSFLKSTKRLTWVILVIAACFSFMTYQRNLVWRDEFTLWDDAVKKAPGKARIYVNRGTAYKNKGLPDQAIADFSRALELDPAYAQAYSNRGALYRNKALLDQGIADCTKAIKIDPSLAAAYMNRGVCYKDKGQLDWAMTDFNKAIELEPHNAETYNNRASVYGMTEMLDEALEDCNRAIGLNPAFPEVYNNRGVVYDRKGLIDEALSDYSKAININPRFAIAYVNRGALYGSKNLWSQALADYSNAQALGYPVDPQILDTLRKNSG